MERPTKEQWERLTEEQQEQVTEWGKSRVWKPEWDEFYWYIDSRGYASRTRWRNGGEDKYRLSINEIYKTREDTEFAMEKKVVIGQLERLAKESGELSDIRYIIGCYSGQLFSQTTNMAVGKFNIIYFATEESCKKAIETVGEDKIRKYYLGV